MDCAKLILEDLLSIRADRENYYYGADALFEHHPELVLRLCDSATELLSLSSVTRARGIKGSLKAIEYVVEALCAKAAGLLWTLLEGLIWRSRVTQRGLRRVNYFIKNLLQD